MKLRYLTLAVCGIATNGCGNFYDLKCEDIEGSSSYSVSVEEGDEPEFSWTGGNANYLGVYGCSLDDYKDPEADCDILWQVRGVSDEIDDNTIVSPVTYGQDSITGGAEDAEAEALVSGETYTVSADWGCRQTGGNSGRGVEAEFDMP
ncbi:MAG: hypothetical protein HN348_36515 [Proteobacteria bacterium]|jgi:hypothetical protein|nr:hypothetical protein [Pseudomonadota bacterium]